MKAALLQPWLRWTWKPAEGRAKVQLGVQGQYFSLNEELSVDPRLLLSYQLSAAHSLSLGGGLYTQLNPLYLYASQPDFDPACVNCDLKMTRSGHAGLRHNWRTPQGWQFAGELFYQYIWQAPEYLNGPEYWSFNNLSELTNCRETFQKRVKVPN